MREGYSSKKSNLRLVSGLTLTSEQIGRSCIAGENTGGKRPLSQGSARGQLVWILCWYN